MDKQEIIDQYMAIFNVDPRVELVKTILGLAVTAAYLQGKLDQADAVIEMQKEALK